MARWLVKTDPRRFGWDDLVEAGRVTWNGVRQPLALRHLRRIRDGDEVLVYHGGGRSSVMGRARAVGDAYVASGMQGEPDGPAVDLEAVAPLERPVHRRELVEDPALADWELLRVPRLTVLPVPAAAWRAVLRCAASRKKEGGPTGGR
jgi:predicted RNA-binding protein with PUA-like domain